MLDHVELHIRHVRHQRVDVHITKLVKTLRVVMHHAKTHLADVLIINLVEQVVAEQKATKHVKLADVVAHTIKHVKTKNVV